MMIFRWSLAVSFLVVYTIGLVALALAMSLMLAGYEFLALLIGIFSMVFLAKTDQKLSS